MNFGDKINAINRWYGFIVYFVVNKMSLLPLLLFGPFIHRSNRNMDPSDEVLTKNSVNVPFKEPITEESYFYISTVIDVMINPAFGLAGIFVECNQHDSVLQDGSLSQSPRIVFHSGSR